MHIQANCSLKPFNTFNMDVKAQYIIDITKQSDIPLIRSDLKLSSLPWVIMGGGSNILFSHDMNKVMVRCGYQKIKILKEDANSVWISVGAGLPWHELVTYTVEHNWWGLENLALIPGLVGASPVQNIGAYGAEARDSITRVQTLNVLTGERLQFRNSECEFDYRNSIFKRKYINQLLVHRVTFRLSKLESGRANLIYEPLKQALEDIEPADLTPKMVYEKVIEIRQRRIPDPKIYGNAGSFFKNPVISETELDKLLDSYPDMPHHQTVDGQYKMSAAWLIEKAGWKGKRIGDAAVSDKHALVLINIDKASGDDIIELSKKIQKDINKQFNILLEPEVIMI